MCSCAQLCLTLCDPMDCSLPGSSVHEIFQTRILEWVAISSSRGSSRPGDQTRVSWVSCIGRWILYLCTTHEANILYIVSHGRRSLVGCSPWGRKESDMTERLHFHFSLSCIGEGTGSPLQCSCLEHPRDGVTQSRTRLKWLSSSG